MRYLYLIIIVIVLIGFSAYRATSTHFECDGCGERFQLGVLKFLVAPKTLGKRFVTCPKCGRKDYMMVMQGKK